MAGMRNLEEWEVEKFLSTIQLVFTWQIAQRYWSAFALQFATGLRASEIISLRIKDVSRDGKKANEYVVVQKHNLKIKRENRIIPASPLAVRAVEAWLLLLKPTNIHGLLYPTCELGANTNCEKGFNEHPIHVCNYVKAFERVARVAGLEPPVCSHSARKTFAVRFYKASGNDIYATSKALGHTDITTTMAYLACSNDKVNNTIRGLFT